MSSSVHPSLSSYGQAKGGAEAFMRLLLAKRGAVLVSTMSLTLFGGPQPGMPADVLAASFENL